MKVPQKPFPTYKWRWLSVQPSEGLLKAPVFLGVLRALQKFEGEAYSSIDLHNELAIVQKETKTTIDLARTPERNLFRNSGQYWRGTGLIVSKRGEIELTNLGHRIASGEITNDEFVTLMVRNTVLPNPQTYSKSELQKWHNAKLRIKPFEIILATVDCLGKSHGLQNAFLTPTELIKIVIPLSGAKQKIKSISETIYEYRNGRIDTTMWPNCAPEANDKRLAREFLLFLENFGLCRTDYTTNAYDQKFHVESVLSLDLDIGTKVSLLEDSSILEEELKISRDSEFPTIIERTRISLSVIQRKNQSRFRREVLNAASGCCVVTNERTPDVLEAAHIIPVSHGGTDNVNNGLCMRVDIHRLFDGGKIRILPDGSIFLNEQIREAVSYRNLPDKINFPPAIDHSNIEWRSNYL